MNLVRVLLLLILPIIGFSQSLESIQPSTATAGKTLEVTITGSNTHFTKGSGTTIYFYPMLQASPTSLNVYNIEVLSDTQIKATVEIPFYALLGYYNVFIMDGSNQLSLFNAFHVTAQKPPKLVSISPNTAINGQTLDVSIMGSNTNFTQGSGTTITFYGNQQESSNQLNVYDVKVLSDSLLQATVAVPTQTYTGDYSVYVQDGNYNYLYLENAFHVDGLTPPKLESISPNTAKNGQTLDVTITGSNTNFMQGSGTNVSFYGYQQGSSTTLDVTNLQVMSDNVIKATVSVPYQTYSGDYSVYVTNDKIGTMYLYNAFHVEGLTPPKLVSVSPNTAKNGQTLDVTITGANTNFTQGSGTSVSFYGYQQGSSTSLDVANLQVVSDTVIQVTVSVPVKTFTGDYSLFVNNGTSSNLYLYGAFHVEGLTPPKLVSVSPNNAKHGQTLDVTITGLNTSFTQGSGTTVSFYSYQQGSNTTLNVSNIQVLSDIVMKATVSVPHNTFTGDYSVMVYDANYNYLTLENAFHVEGVSPPKLVAISPNTAKNGQTLDVTISASGTNFMQGSGTTVSFYADQPGNGTTVDVYNVKVLSDSAILVTVYVPYKTITSDYSVYVYDGVNSNLYLASAFHVEGLSAPKLVAISPNTAKNGQTLDVTITGSNTNFTQGSNTTVAFYGYQQGSPTALQISNIHVNSDTLIHCTVSVPQNTYSGYYTVVVVDGSTSNLFLENAFYVNGLTPPQLVTINPNSASQGQTLDVTITGKNTIFTQGSSTSVYIYSKKQGGNSILTISAVNVLSDTVVKATVFVPTTSILGEYDVRVSDDKHFDYVLENGFTVNPKNVGISETSDLGLSVYPNPTNDFVILDLQKPNDGMYRYKIVDITGKELLVSTIHANKTQISLKSIGVEGVYFMHILDSSNSSISIKKIVLE